MKVGIVTYVHGWYVDYIPFFIYAVSKSYPEYEVRVFLRETLTDSVRRNLVNLRGKAKFSIKEGYLADIGVRSDKTNKPYYIRWLIPYYSLKDLDVAFICDVDTLIMTENPTMVDQRLEICKRHNLPFANYQRDYHEDYPPRITGWHFIKVHDYYKEAGWLIDKLRDEDIDITTMQNKYCYINSLGESQWGQESLLHYIIRKIFGDVELSEKFPTHHGIHLGPIRSDQHIKLYERDPKIVEKFGLNAKYWYDAQAFEFVNDRILNKMIKELADSNVKLVMAKFVQGLKNVYI